MQSLPPINSTVQWMWNASTLIQKGKINKTNGSLPSTSSPPCQYTLLILKNANRWTVPTLLLPSIKRIIIYLAHGVQNNVRAEVKWQKEYEAVVVSSGRCLLNKEGIHKGIHQPSAPCCSSFWRLLSSFEMFTRCIIRNWPFRWKTGMSNLYLSYHAVFSGSVMSTSCKINWNGDRLKPYILENMGTTAVTNWSPD